MPRQPSGVNRLLRNPIADVERVRDEIVDVVHRAHVREDLERGQRQTVGGVDDRPAGVMPASGRQKTAFPVADAARESARSDVPRTRQANIP